MLASARPVSPGCACAPSTRRTRTTACSTARQGAQLVTSNLQVAIRRQCRPQGNKSFNSLMVLSSSFAGRPTQPSGYGLIHPTSVRRKIWNSAGRSSSPNPLITITALATVFRVAPAVIELGGKHQAVTGLQAVAGGIDFILQTPRRHSTNSYPECIIPFGPLEPPFSRVRAKGSMRPSNSSPHAFPQAA
jgi:hypothetical protein